MNQPLPPSTGCIAVLEGGAGSRDYIRTEVSPCKELIVNMAVIISGTAWSNKLGSISKVCSIANNS